MQRKPLLFRKNDTEQQNKVIVCDLAASDSRGKITLYKNSENKGDNRIYPDTLLDEEETVVSNTLDYICELHGITSVQFVKLDVQGAEAKVIRGASKILSNSPDCILMTEAWAYGLSRCGSNVSDYIRSLRSFGFTIHELRNKSLISINADLLATRTSGRKYATIIGLKGCFARR